VVLAEGVLVSLSFRGSGRKADVLLICDMGDMGPFPDPCQNRY